MFCLLFQSCSFENPKLSNTVKIENTLNLSNLNLKKIKTRLMKDSDWMVIKNNKTTGDFYAVLRDTSKFSLANTANFRHGKPYVNYWSTVQVVIKSPDIIPLKRINKRNYKISYCTDKTDSLNIYCYKMNTNLHPHYISHINIKNEFIGIEIYEESIYRQRCFSDSILKKINSFLNEDQNIALSNKDENIIHNSYEHGEFVIFEPFEYNYNYPCIQIIKDDKFEYCHGKIIKGEINTKTEGKLYLKVFNSKTNKNVLLKMEPYNNPPQEFVGWSENENEKFYFEIPFAYTNGSNRKYDEKLELWFHPSDNTGDFIVYQKSYKNRRMSGLEKWLDNLTNWN